MLSVLACAATALSVATSPTGNAYSALKSVQVLQTATGALVALTDQWTSDERAVMVLMRSVNLEVLKPWSIECPH